MVLPPLLLERTSWVQDHKSVVTEFARQCGADRIQAFQVLAHAITGAEECRTALAVGLGIIDPVTLTDGGTVQGGTSTACGMRARETGFVKEVAAVVGGVAAMGLLC
ncbi:Putative protein of unknown function [Podospora comata]|uniref:Uncharacterized protein n=1 Tax=Podospora comata TaxID=48703 RepID=A0ABY6SCH2_PODCO|nr:Putative protein of unknown function [Podospora comata]